MQLKRTFFKSIKLYFIHRLLALDILSNDWMFSSTEEMKRLILHTLDHMLSLSHSTGLVESNQISAMLKMKIYTVKMVVHIK